MRRGALGHVGFCKHDKTTEMAWSGVSLSYGNRNTLTGNERCRLVNEVYSPLKTQLFWLLISKIINSTFCSSSFQSLHCHFPCSFLLKFHLLSHIVSSDLVVLLVFKVTLPVSFFFFRPNNFNSTWHLQCGQNGNSLFLQNITSISHVSFFITTSLKKKSQLKTETHVYRSYLRMLGC